MSLHARRHHERDPEHDHRGFTLMELIITITILGVLSGVVVFGALRFGGTSACGSDARMLRNAEGTFFVKNGRYGTQAELVAQGLLPKASTLHDVTPTGLSYTVTELGSCVGSGSGDADSSAVVAPTTIPGITLLVTGADGHPVAAVQGQYRLGAGAWQDIGLTNAKGFVNAPVSSGTYDVRARYHGVTSTVAGVSVGVGSMVYVSTVSLTAQILTYDGAQIQGALPEAQGATGTGWFSLPLTGPAGSTIDVLPGAYDVRMTYNGVTATQTNQPVVSATTVTFLTAPLTVHVINKGSGVAGVSVTFTPTGGTALPVLVTDVDGIATYDLLPSSYDLEAVYVVPGGAQTHTASLDAVPTGTQPGVVELKANR